MRQRTSACLSSTVVRPDPGTTLTRSESFSSVTGAASALPNANVAQMTAMAAAGFNKCAFMESLLYPLMAPSVNPWMKCFMVKTNSTSNGTQPMV